MKTLKKHFISGIIFIVPIALSLWILFKIFTFLENILGNFFKKFFPNIYTPGVGLISLILLILFVGFIANNFLGRKLLNLIETFFENLPFLNKIFGFIKGLVKRITESKTDIFKGVVKIKFSNEMYTIGFITNEFDNNSFCIFIPTVPNPSTGIVLILPKNNVEVLNISVEQAFKLIISMGFFSSPNATNKN
ncbi:MAG: DUF502 domain-containing protein [Candidatus Omnitrophica bacterium]|nr:DUF502 domain-containing protein [Candidatus Omnitrophota bacterium]